MVPSSWFPDPTGALALVLVVLLALFLTRDFSWRISFASPFGSTRRPRPVRRSWPVWCAGPDVSRSSLRSWRKPGATRPTALLLTVLALGGLASTTWAATTVA